jgi:PAS domain S-box-containing protein
VIGHTSVALNVFKDPAAREQIMRELDQNGRVRNYETVYQTRAGETRCISIHLDRLAVDERRYLLSTIENITQRKEAAQALERYRMLVERSRDIFLTVRRTDGRILDANPAAERAYGYSREELLRLTISDLRAPQTFKKIDVQMQQADKNGVLFETHHRRKNGAVFPVEVSSIGTDLAGERVNLSIIRDISDRKQAETAVRESEQRLATLLSSITDCCFALDTRWRISLLNSCAEAYFDQPREQLLGRVFWEAFPTGLGTDTEHNLRRAMEEQTPVHYEILSPLTGRWVDAHAYPSVEGLLVIFRDITERKQVEESVRQLHLDLAGRNAELEAERQRWQGVVEGIADEVWICNLAGQMTLINLPQNTAMGLEEFEDKTYAQVLDEVDILYVNGSPRPEDQAPLLRSLRGEIARGEEIMRHRQTGRTRYRQYSSAPLHDATGKITGAVAIVRDITEMRQAEVEMQTRAIQIELQQRLLEQREQERLQIARDLHDGPVQALTGITLALRGVLMDQCPADIADPLETIQSQLQAQIGELRAFAGELRPPALSKFGLGRAIRSHIGDFQANHPDLQVTFDEAQEGDLLPEEVRLALFRIYQEALVNITKHAQATSVIVSLQKSDDQVILDVADNGTGFEVPNDWLEFARHKHLGLVGIQERAEVIGGEVKIVSRIGRGTQVKVTVPLPRQAGQEHQGRKPLLI